VRESLKLYLLRVDITSVHWQVMVEGKTVYTNKYKLTPAVLEIVYPLGLDDVARTRRDLPMS